MSSSRGAAEPTPADATAPRGRPAAVLVVLAVIAIPVGFGVLALFSQRSTEAPLAGADAVLDNLVRSIDATARLKLGANLAQLAEPHREADGETGDRARFLWSVGRSVVDADAAAREFETVDLGRIPVDWLGDGANVLFQSRAFGLADRTIAAALERTGGADDEEREHVLRTATVIRFELGRDDDVLAHCRELAELAPGDARPHEVAAMVHRNRGHWDHFVDAQQRALERNPGDPPARKAELLEGYLELARTADARRVYDDVSATHPDLLDRLPLLEPRLLLLEGRTDEATALLDEHLAAHRDDPEALLLRGRLLVATGEFEMAAEVLERVLAGDPANHAAHYQLGQALARLGQRDEAERHLKLHRRILDEKVRLYHLERQAAREPGNVDVRRELATVYAELGLDDLADFWRRAADAADG